MWFRTNPRCHSVGIVVNWRLGFISSPEHLALVENSKPITQIKVSDYDAVLFIGGEGPMYTFYNDDRVHTLAAEFYKAGKITGVLCHGTCLLLKAKVDGKLLVTGKTWTGFANSEEKYADDFIGKRMQPFWIEDEAKKFPDTNFIVSGRFKSHAVRDGNLITGQRWACSDPGRVSGLRGRFSHMAPAGRFDQL